MYDMLVLNADEIKEGNLFLLELKGFQNFNLPQKTDKLSLKQRFKELKLSKCIFWFKKKIYPPMSKDFSRKSKRKLKQLKDHY